MKNTQSRAAFAFVFDFSISGRKPFREDQDEEVDGQSEMIHRTQHLEVILYDRDHMVDSESCEGYWHFVVLSGTEGESGGRRKSSYIQGNPTCSIKGKNHSFFRLVKKCSGNRGHR